MRRLFLSVGLMLLVSGAVAADSPVLSKLMSAPQIAGLGITPEKSEYEIQILYTQINRDENGNPTFVPHSFGLDTSRYFYPASSVKLAAAVLALEKLNLLATERLTRDTQLLIDSSFAGQSSVLLDPDRSDSIATIAGYVEKIFVVSDNDAYNRLYEFLGQEGINQGLWRRGLKSARLTHRLSVARTAGQNRHTNPFRFIAGGEVVYQQPGQASSLELQLEKNEMRRGDGYLSGDSIIYSPMDFSAKNFISLPDLQGILQRVIFPDAFPAEQRFALSASDRSFLLRTMGLLPSESTIPAYHDTSHYWDSYVKFALYGDTKKPLPDNIRILNKVGLAYGFLIENAYIADLQNNIEFFLSAVIHVNANRIYNDGQYEYDETGLPFLARLGALIYQYESDRQKTHPAGLNEIRTLFRH
jgi:hypothetical protein